MTTTDQAGVTLEFPLADYPGIGRFALDLVEGSDRAGAFCRRVEWDAIAPRAASRDRAALAAALRRTNRAWRNDVDAPIAAWARGDAVAIVAGQQVGFAGGPLYTLAKIASLVAIRRRLERRGVAAVPFFWLATEDHDYDEVATVHLQRDGAMETLRALERPSGRFPVGPLPVPPSLREAIEAWCGRRPSWVPDGATFGDAFAALLVEAIGEGEVVLVDSLLPELRREGRDLFARLAASLPEVDAAIEERSDRLRDAGYAPQVTRGPEGSYSLLYAIAASGERVAIGRGDANLLETVRERPESISTGVLARPLLQDLVFEPSIFVGGPAEVAYYAQIGGLHERLGIAPPAVVLRGHALVAPAKRLRALDAHGLDVVELFAPLEQALEAREGAPIDAAEAAIRTAEEALERAAGDVAAIALGADPGLDRSMRRSRRRIAYHLARMRDRARAAVVRRDRERWNALARLQEILVPGGTVQDRLAGWLGWHETWGRTFFRRMVDEIQPDEPVVRIIGYRGDE